MRHSELVQLATDLLADSGNPEFWLPLYDEALASDDDSKLQSFVDRISSKRRAA